MLFDIALIIVISLSLSLVFEKLRIPSIIAFMITGIILGPYIFNVITLNQDVSADLKEIALIVILLRAGLSLDLRDLKKVGRPAILLSFIPSTVEIVFIGLASTWIFHITYIEGFMMGSIVAAVSPAVVVPRMVHFIHEKIGTDKQIPQMVLAGSSIDNIFALVIFAIFSQAYQTGTFALNQLFLFPVTIIASLALGIGIGLLLVFMFKKIHIRDTIKIIAIFGIALLIIVLEQAIKDFFSISGLLAIIALGATMLETHPELANRLTHKFSKIWVAAEIMLFVLVGAAVNLSININLIPLSIVLILSSLALRMGAVYLSVSKTRLNKKEKIFTCISYMPKATVQAAIGAVPLALGVPAGNLILMISVLAIFITAPIGAIGIDQTHKKLLQTQ